MSIQPPFTDLQITVAYTPSPAESDFDGLTAGFETIQLCL